MTRMLLAAIGIGAALGMGAAHAAGDAQAGRAEGARCAGSQPQTVRASDQHPPLVGLREDRFVQAMEDYKSGKRENAVTNTFATPLSGADMANSAAYCASLKK
jgi:cytochrome c553